MKIEYDSLTERFLLSGGGKAASLALETLIAEPERAAAFLLQLRKAAPQREATRPAPVGIAPAVEDFVARGGDIKRYTRVATAWGVNGDLDRERERKAKLSRQRSISSLSIEDLDLDTL